MGGGATWGGAGCHIKNTFISGDFQAVAGINKLLQEEGFTVGDYYGGIKSRASCQSACETNPSCNSFTYCTGENNCHLKSLVVLGTEPTKSGGTCTSYYRKNIKQDRALNGNGNLQHSYEVLGNGDDGFCRNSDGNKRILGDWNVNSMEKCRLLCDSFFACAGFQYGRSGNNQDCNLYYEADKTSHHTHTLTGCRKKLDKLDHDGYTWKGAGYCRDSNDQKHSLPFVTVTDEIQCVKECDQDPACEGFALGNPSNPNRCYLYSSAFKSSGSSGLGGCWAKN